ncbi:MAG: hypothetical protein AAGC71_00400 [Pseudomonadota bacterium]
MGEQAPADDTVARYAKGRRPGFYADPAMDEAMSMIMVLASELSVLRDRLDTVEQVFATKTSITRDDIENYAPDEDVLARRESERQDFLKRLFFVANKRAAELAGNDTPERYAEVLETTARDDA